MGVGFKSHTANGGSSLIAAGLIRPDPIIKASLDHLCCDKKKSRNDRKESDRKIE